MRRIVLGFALGASAALVLCSIIGATSPVRAGQPIESEAAEVALDFAFRDARPERMLWHAASGTAHHGWLFRTAYVEGSLGAESGVGYSEQVLKVGWPFTVVRGFIRTAGDEVELEGARLVGGVDRGQPVRLVPMQPVWPGMALYGLLGMVAAIGVARWQADSHVSGVTV